MEGIHTMITRSKARKNDRVNPVDLIGPNDPIDPNDSDNEIDEKGNLKGFIEYDLEEDPNIRNELNEQLYLLSNKSSSYKIESPPKRKKRKKTKNKKLNDFLVNYLIMRATDKANLELKKKRKKKKVKVVIEEDKNNLSEEISESESDISLTDSEELSDLEPVIGPVESVESVESAESAESAESGESGESIESVDLELSDSFDSESIDSAADSESKSVELESEDESSDSEYDFELDEIDEKYNDLLDKHSIVNTEENDMEYFHNLEKDTKLKLIEEIKTIYEMNETNIPLRFKIINSEMDLKTKAVAIENIDKLADMDISSGEYSKMDHWINGLIKIPFGKYQTLQVNPESSNEEKRTFINETYLNLDKAIYGHKEAKTHILQVIGKWIKNPTSGGNVLAIQGPMGNGKTTLVKEGISKVLNRPFAFIALGGASDSAFFDGHSYTYEGSHWGRIVQILHDSKCMNPIIYFDELDKVSDTQKGDEIIHMLTHLTDPSQNSLFQDNYFPGINLDLSKALFIFSYNDESKINKILKDRMYVIHTKGFKPEDKLKISRDYLLPELMEIFGFTSEDIIFTDEILKEIIEKYTQGEEGVRNLKRCLETIVSKINIYNLCTNPNGEKVKLTFDIKDFKLPIKITEEIVKTLVAQKDDIGRPPEHMYM